MCSRAVLCKAFNGESTANLLLASLSKRVYETGHRSYIVLPCYRHLAIVKGCVHVVGAKPHREHPRYSVLHSSACLPREFVRETSYGLVAAREVDSCFSRAAKERFGIHREPLFSDRIKHRARHITQNVCVVVRAEYVEAAHISDI